MEQKKRTEISTLGPFGLIDLLTKDFPVQHAPRRRRRCRRDRPADGRSGAVHDRFVLRRGGFRPHLLSAQTSGL